MYIYEYKKERINYNKNPQKFYDEYIFEANYDTEFKENKYVYLHVFNSKRQEIKGDIIFLHGIGDGNIPYLEWYGKYFSKAGYRVTFVILPYHLKRKPEGIKGGEPFYSAEPTKCVVRFHKAVKDVRRSIDLLEAFQNYKENNLFLMGISFGGIIGTMVMGLDKRIKKGVLVGSGGDWRWINFHSAYTENVRNEYRTKGNSYGCNSEKYCITHFRRDPVKFCSENFNSIQDIFEKSPIPCYHYDPLSYAKFVNQKVLFIRAMFDKIMPKQASKELASLLPKKEVKIIPTGHKSTILLKKTIGNWALKHFEGE